MRRVMILAVAALVMGGAAVAIAQTPGGTTTAPGTTNNQPGAAAPVGPLGGEVLPEPEIRERLEKDGYSNIGPMMLQGTSYETKATKDGRTVNLTVDARTGNVRSRY